MLQKNLLNILISLCLTWISCQTIQPITNIEKASPKRYNWHQRLVHPCFGIIERHPIQGTTIAINLDTKEFNSEIPAFMDVLAHVTIDDSLVTFEKRFQIKALAPLSQGIWQGKITFPIHAQFLEDVVLKFGPNGTADQFHLHWALGANGWETDQYLQTNIISSGSKIVPRGNGDRIFASLSDKLPSPPFSTNAPFIPDGYEKLKDDSILTTVGAYIFWSDSAHTSSNTIIAIDPILHPGYPKWVTTSEMASPMRYLCSKEEFDKISKSTDGAENAMEKFWIQSAGGREKARKIIKTYYERVWDANHHFTSYAEGWKTDRGMIYLVFGHPEKIELENNMEIWSYTLETGQLQFGFELLKHPVWGEIYILKRNEQYRSHWEFQVSQWRQGRIFK